MSTKSSKSSLRSWVMWELKLHGPVNENHKGGNAMQTLKQRLTMHGAPQAAVDNLSTIISQLVSAGKLHRLAKGHRSYVIRLEPDVTMGSENPYPDEVVKQVQDDDIVIDGELVEVDKPLMNGYRSWPISQRLQLIAEISQSVHEDIEKAKASL